MKALAGSQVLQQKIHQFCQLQVRCAVQNVLYVVQHVHGTACTEYKYTAQHVQLYTVQNVHGTACCARMFVQLKHCTSCTLHTVHSVQPFHCTACTLYNVQHLHWSACTFYSRYEYIAQNAHCTLHIVRVHCKACKLYSRYMVHNLNYTTCTLHSRYTVQQEHCSPLTLSSRCTLYTVISSIEQHYD